MNTPRTEAEAIEMGWTVDKHTYPWRAYSGPCFTPDAEVNIETPAHNIRRPEPERRSVFILEHHSRDGDNRECSTMYAEHGVFATRELAQAECDKLNKPRYEEMERRNAYARQERDIQQREHDALVAAGLKKPHKFGRAHQRTKPDEYYSVEEHELVETSAVGRCPDDGACHHHCVGQTCYRVQTCGPLSGVFPNNEWPEEVVKLRG